jgi:hypothetical protein
MEGVLIHGLEARATENKTPPTDPFGVLRTRARVTRGKEEFRVI